MNEQSFMKSLFHGVIVESALASYPELLRTEVDAVHNLLDAVRKLCAAQVDSARIDRDAAIEPSILDGLKKLGLFGMEIPRAYGGLGLSLSASSRVLQELAGLDLSLATTVLAHQSIGFKGVLLHGDDAMKQRYLPALARGEHLAAFALTEEAAGSDASSIQMRADRTPDGNFRLTGTKLWVTNGGIADLFTVFARTSPPDEGAKPRITAFLVERKWGVVTGGTHAKLGVRGTSTTSLHFEDVPVPRENVLGEVGRGIKTAMEILNVGRLGLASSCLGSCKRLIKLSVEHAQRRKAFGRSIGEFGLVKDKIALMMADTFALESMVYLTTAMVDGQAGDYSIESALCKVFGSEAVWRVVNEAAQIAGGAGYMQSSPYERLLRDTRMGLAFEGTNEILRCFVALSGMQGPGRELADVARAVREPIKGFGLLSDFAIRKARTALGRERLTKVHPLLNREAVVFEDYVADLAKNVDKVLRKHGNTIAEMQYTQRRVADMAMELFAIASVLARASGAIARRGEEGARREVDLATMFVAGSERRLAETVLAFDKNDDELRKAIATKSYADGGYPLDIL